MSKYGSLLAWIEMLIIVPLYGFKLNYFLLDNKSPTHIFIETRQ